MSITHNGSGTALARRKVILFLALALVLSTASFVPVIRAGSMNALGGAAVWLGMWAPGVAAMLTQLITEGTLKGMGWKPRTMPLLMLALVLPLIYALPVYAFTWGFGIGQFAPQNWAAEVGAAGAGPALLILLTAGLLFSLATAAGEEIGWRGLLVPQLAKLTSFRNVWLISAVIWLIYHVPLILFADYHGNGTPQWFSLACFAGSVFFMSGIMAWIRLRSGSLWPPALLHASHNLLVQSVFDAATNPGTASGWIIGEFGIGLVLTLAITAWVLLSRGRNEAA